MKNGSGNGEQSMMCPKCGSVNVQCVDSRQTPDNLTRRRRWCEDCCHRFSTVEITVDEYQATKKKLALLQTILNAVKEEIKKGT